MSTGAISALLEREIRRETERRRRRDVRVPKLNRLSFEARCTTQFLGFEAERLINMLWI